MTENKTWEMVYDNKPHYCTKPYLKANNPEIVSGAIIKCKECGQHWKCTGFDSGMQWDLYPTVIQWEKTDRPMLIRAY